MRSSSLALAGVMTLSAATVRGGETPWLEVKSPHFTVVGNAGEKTTRRVAWQFEQIRAALEQIWPWAGLGSGRPVVVVAVRDEATLRSLAPQFWEGKGFRPSSVFVSGSDRHYIALRTDVSVPDDEAVNPYFTAYQGYAYLLVNANFSGDTPLWFRRGLAELVANTVVREKYVQFGRAIPFHLELLRGTARIPLGALLAADRRSKYFTGETEVRVFDAQSWALVHYLMLGDGGARAARLNRYAGLLHERRDPDAAFREALGDPAPYADALTEYIGRRLFEYQRLPITVQIKEEAFPARPLTHAASAAVQAGLHAAMGRPVEARALAAEAKRGDPSLPGPWEAEGMVLDGEGKKDEARAAYAKAIELGADSFYSHYRLAQLLWSSSLDREAQQRIAVLLEKAVQLNPEYAFGWSFLAETRSGLGAGDEALLAGRRAVALEPNESYHRQALARVHWKAGRGEEARAEARAALQLAASDEAKKNCQEFLDFLARDADARARAGDQKSCFETKAPEACERVAPAMERSCREGDASACMTMAWLAENGLGPKADATGVAGYYGKACAAGDKAACMRQAVMQAQGEGTPKDLAGATATLDALCQANDLGACQYLAMLEMQKRTPAGQARARPLLKKACDGGLPGACRLLASLPR